MTLLDKREYYKPFNYPWAYEAYKQQQRIHWLPDEVPLREDVRDWNRNLDEGEKNLLTQIFRFFTQGDVDVAQGYLHKYIPIFGHQPELAMMLSSFANMEAVHVDAYSLLLDTLGLPESEYQAFSKYTAMANKHEYLSDVDTREIVIEARPVGASFAYKQRTAKGLAVYSAFTEGLQLFSSFAILLNFPRHNKMKGMGQIVTWSIRDESLHVESMIKLFETFINENPEIWTDDFRGELYQVCRDMVDLEDAFIDLAFEQGGIQDMEATDVKQYVRFIADRRLLQLGLKPNYGVKDNPLPWIDDMVSGVEHANFFETRATEYTRANGTGWGNIFDNN